MPKANIPMKKQWEKEFSEMLTTLMTEWKNTADVQKVYKFCEKQKKKAHLQGFIEGAHATGEQADEIMAEKVEGAREKALNEALEALPKHTDCPTYVSEDVSGNSSDPSFTDGYGSALLRVREVIKKVNNKKL